MKLPQFICVGSQKAGTTSLFNIIKQHSGIFLPDIKEVHFFDNENNYSKGLSFYSFFFKKALESQIKGEFTPNYMYLDLVPERIFKNLGENLKFIFLLRNPADRAFSHYKMRIGRGEEKNTFKNAVMLELDELKKSEYTLKHKYIDIGFYDVQISRFLKYFDKKNMFFMLFEDEFLNNREQTVKKLLYFLGVDYSEEIAFNIKSTPEGAHKSETADKLLNTSNPINKFAKIIIPSKKLRTDIKYFFTKLNFKPTADISQLEEIRPFFNKYGLQRQYFKP